MKNILFVLIYLAGIWSLSAQPLAMVEGTLQIGSFDVPSQISLSGTIQWTGSDLVGFNGEKWVSLTTGVGYDGTVEDEDGNVYFTIEIGDQEWMAENLKTTKYNDGTSIDLITTHNSWGKTNLSSQGAYCWFDNDPSNGQIYGALYNWYAVNTGNLCPSGWRVPDDSEWNELSNLFGGNNDSGGTLKAEFEIYWGFPNVGATNESGYTAQPGGLRSFDGNFSNITEVAYFWSATPFSSNAKERSILKQFDNLYEANSDRRSGYSVRCIKN